VSDSTPTSVVVQAPPDTALDAGTSVGLKLNPEKTYLFDPVTGSAQLTRERISLA
jgi:sn-glycerol 3-phosphate transport system ATP-binding protein